MEANITEDVFLEYMALDFPSFKVTKCNLAYPTSDFVTSFYTLIIETITSGGSKDHLWNLTEEQCNYIKANQNEGSSFLQHAYSRNLHAAVKYIFSQVNPNVPEFTYSDILQPENTPRRTFVFMSFMLYCFYYYVTFSEELDGEMVACEKKGQEIREKRDLKLKLMNQLREYEGQKTERAESLNNIKSTLLKYSSANKEKENILKELDTKQSLVNADLSKMEEQERNHQEELIKLENSVKYFESLIVSNPNEAAETFKSNEMKKDECKNKMKNLEDQVRISSSQLSRFNKVRELQQILNNIIQKNDDTSGDAKKMDFKELQKSINDLSGKLSNLKTLKSKLETQYLEKELHLLKLMSDNSQIESALSTAKCQWDEKCKGYNECIVNMEKSYTQMSIKMRKDAEGMDKINIETDELNKKCLDLEEKIKLIDSETKEKYLWCSNEMKNAFGSIHQTLMN